jgi:hypothetical protein
MVVSRPLIVKSSGGAAAQTLALMDAIYVTRHDERPFVFDYYPYGTGTYWPLEIEGALSVGEVGNTLKFTVGHLQNDQTAQVGKIVETHPINSQSLNLEKVYATVRRLNLDRYLLALRGEVPINSSPARLGTIKKSTRIISGGYIPILNHAVFQNLHTRFTNAGFDSPFDLSEDLHSEYDVVIHYRIGDKRAKFTHPGVVGSDGIMDPRTIYKLLSRLNLVSSTILVLSDDPEIAQDLLSEVGISADIQKKRSGIWEDLRTMAGAKVFIGSWSQVSQLASVCVVGHGGSAYLPSNAEGKNSLSWSISGVNTYVPEFLGSSHPIYYKK